MTATRIVVIGGGYAGVLAANRLSQRSDFAITLVNPRPMFVERIRLHQLVAGNHSATDEFAAVLAPAVRLVVDTADRIDVDAHQVHLRSQAPLTYDYLVYAVGSTASVPATVSGAGRFAYPLGEWEAAQQLTARLTELPMDAPIVVVGGGLTGIEAASELAESGRQVTLVTDVVGPSLARGGRRSVTKRLSRLGVGIVDGTAVAAVAADHVVLTDGRHLPSAATVWTAGFGVPGLAADSGLRTDRLGRLVTDETLTYVDNPSIVAAGDAACPSGVPLRMSCQLAMPLAASAADTVIARLDGATPRTINPASVGQCISVGRRAGTIQLSRFDDVAVPAHLGGRAAATIKEAVCAGTVTFLTKEARRPGSYFWPRGGGRRRSIARAAREAQATT